jgi:type I restriction enzyme S subunit
MNRPGNERYIRTTMNSIDERTLRAMKATAFPAGAIVLPKVGAALETNKRRILVKATVLDNNMMAWMSTRVSQEFLYQWSLRVNMKRYSQTGSLPSVNKTIVEQIPVLLPPLAEQRRIAEILSTWDAAIEQTEKLIAAKERRKRALMQQLLTGKRRFREFEGEGWKPAHLDEVASIRFSGVDKKTEAGELPVRLCNYMDVYRNGVISSSIEFMSATATPIEIERFTLQVGDVLITKDSETPDDIGVAARVGENLDNVLCGYHLALIRPELRRLDPAFLTHLFGERGMQYKLSTLANGATRYGLTNGAISKLRILLPSLAEQQKIAAILNTADLEVVQLKNQLTALRRQKQGLMQVLLTGRVRVNCKDEGGRMKDEEGGVKDEERRMKDEEGRIKDEGGRMKDEGGRVKDEEGGGGGDDEG